MAGKSVSFEDGIKAKVTEELLMLECDTVVNLLREATTPLEAYCIMEEWQQNYEDWRKAKTGENRKEAYN